MQEVTKETVNHPLHYQGCSIEGRPIVELFIRDLDLLDSECIVALERSGINSFCLGNAIKYLWRCGQKGDRVEDLRKALWYLNRVLYPERMPWWAWLKRWNLPTDNVMEAIALIDERLEVATTATHPSQDSSP